jgi:hypothetical protein
VSERFPVAHTLHTRTHGPEDSPKKLTFVHPLCFVWEKANFLCVSDGETLAVESSWAQARRKLQVSERFPFNTARLFTPELQ